MFFLFNDWCACLCVKLIIHLQYTGTSKKRCYTGTLNKKRNVEEIYLLPVSFISEFCEMNVP